MLLLSLAWLLIGALIGLLANVAQWRPATWNHRGWLVMMGMGSTFALGGGWLGVWLLGKYFATGMALWIAIVGIVIMRWGVTRVKHASR